MFFSILAVVIVVCIFGADAEGIKEDKESNNKIFVIPPPNNYVNRPWTKPTPATNVHYPGIPPGWPITVSTTTRKSWPFIMKPNNSNNRANKPQRISPDVIIQSPNVLQDEELTVTEMQVESQKIIVHSSQNLTLPPNKNGVVDWFLGIVGLKPPEGSGSNNNNNNINNNQPQRICPSCICGLTYKHNRIVGGIETQVNEYPWMVALMYNNRFYCGASLINNRYILTAAHCVNGFSKERLSATFLDHDRSNSFESQTFTRRIQNVFRHRYYGSGGSYNNDIALLKLDQDVPVTGILRPVCLPAMGKSYTGYKGIATGWGATREHGQVSNKLREVEVPIMSNIDCRRTGYSNKITDNMMCAGYPQGKKDSCQGDSGGPLHVRNGSYHMIVGIVSWGEGCAEPNYPGVYTRVNRYISWIKSNTKDACYC